MAAQFSKGTANAFAGTKSSSHSITGLKRWSCQTRELPPVQQIKSFHIYDFDNTLFRSPLPNAKLWNPYTLSRLQNQDVFVNGGWWHDNHILEVTGQGIALEEPRAWAGWWNEQIVELVRLSMQQHDCINVLLTGRGERRFSDLIKRMVGSYKLDFDLICLKPEVGPKHQRFASTMQYKQAFLEDLVYTYPEAGEILVYEDRPKQTKGFRDFFQNLNQITFPETSRKPLKADIIQVVDQVTALDPVVEAAEVQAMINMHNSQLPPMSRQLGIRRTVFFTGYLLSPPDTAKLLDLVKIPSNMVESEIKYLANSVLIVPRPADQAIMNKVGGIGTKQTWQVTGFAFYQSSVWAVRVAPIPPTASVYTTHQPPLIVLATYKNAKPELANSIKNWQPVPIDKQYVLQTEVGEKVQLRIDSMSGAHDDRPMADRRGTKRRFSPSGKGGLSQSDHHPPQAAVADGKAGSNARSRDLSTAANGGRVGSNQRGGKFAGHSNMRPARQRGFKGNYRSLDEVAPNNSRYAQQRGEPNYDDYGVSTSENLAPFQEVPAGLQYGQ